MTNKGVVTQVDGDMLTVVFERHEACGDCHACMHGSADCAKHTVQIRGKADVGDQIVVEMDDSKVVSASAAAYLAPFAGMMLGLGAGWWLGGMQTLINRELVEAAGAILGTAAAYFIMKLLDPKLAKGRWEQRIVSVTKPVKED
ncbi:MAG: SoxR reducing system RseC family protein [Clostridia bacterium]|nr:SoxR reducing system RseC family protein [Clostridia bacterium]